MEELVRIPSGAGRTETEKNSPGHTRNFMMMMMIIITVVVVVDVDSGANPGNTVQGPNTSWIRLNFTDIIDFLKMSTMEKASVYPWSDNVLSLQA